LHAASPPIPTPAWLNQAKARQALPFLNAIAYFFHGLSRVNDARSRMILKFDPRREDPSPALGYLVALFACVIAGIAQYVLEPFLGERFPLAVFSTAVIVAAWFGGFGPGLAATLVASLAAAYLFPRPLQQLQIEGVVGAAPVLFFALAGILVSLAVRHLRTQARSERAARAETERQLWQTDQLHQLTATLSRARTPAEVVRASLPELLHAVDAAAGAVFLVADGALQGELAYAVGFDDSLTTSWRSVSVSFKPLLAEAIHRHELRIADGGAWQTLDASPVPGARDLKDHRGAVAVPLVTAGRAIGAVVLTFDRPQTLDGDQRELLLNAGRHTAQALDRARLYDAAERSRAEAESLRARADSELRERHKAEEALRLSETKYRALAARTSRLYALSAGLSEAVTMEAVAKAIASHSKVVVGASAGSVAVLVDGGAQFETLYAEGYPRQIAEAARRFTAQRGLCSTAAVESRLPVFIGSFAEWQEKYPRSASIAADGGYASAASLPLLVDGVVFGVLSFHFTVPVNFDEEYQTLLMSVAQHCAQALDRARLYETAEQARAAAEAANRSKDDFLSTVSHELRTPLNAILGWAAMLRNGTIEPGRTTRAIEAIFDNATRQGRLIEELLDVSRIVAGRAALDLQNVNVSENIRGAVEAMMPSAAAKGLELHFSVAPDVFVVADPRRLEQVFLNLLANAVKFTPTGGRVSVDVGSANEWVHVRVADNGVGIESEFLPHVFERFHQADSTTKRSAGGLGLGLFIVRHLVEAQGGTVRVESDGAGHGTAFTVTLPQAPLPAPIRPPAANASEHLPTETLDRMPRLPGIRVLLVDDEPDALEMMASALSTCGATVMSASSAQEAIRMLAQSDIDVLLSDIAMPEQDGYELIREIRAMHPPHVARIPAAAVTACVRDDERERAIAAGFQAHIAKPVHPLLLAKTVAALAHVVTSTVKH
jgi:K+-sensing histidine kinase KdpD